MRKSVTLHTERYHIYGRRRERRDMKTASIGTHIFKYLIRATSLSFSLALPPRSSTAYRLRRPAPCVPSLIRIHRLLRILHSLLSATRHDRNRDRGDARGSKRSPIAARHANGSIRWSSCTHDTNIIYSIRECYINPLCRVWLLDVRREEVLSRSHETL